MCLQSPVPKLLALPPLHALQVDLSTKSASANINGSAACVAPTCSKASCKTGKNELSKHPARVESGVAHHREFKKRHCETQFNHMPRTALHCTEICAPHARRHELMRTHTNTRTCPHMPRTYTCAHQPTRTRTHPHPQIRHQQPTACIAGGREALRSAGAGDWPHGWQFNASTLRARVAAFPQPRLPTSDVSLPSGGHGSLPIPRDEATSRSPSACSMVVDCHGCAWRPQASQVDAVNRRRPCLATELRGVRDVSSLPTRNSGTRRHLRVLACEVGGRWGQDAVKLVADLLRVRERRAPPSLRRTAAVEWERHWPVGLGVG